MKANIAENTIEGELSSIDIDKDSKFPDSIVRFKLSDGQTLELELKKGEYKDLGSKVIDYIAEKSKSDVDMRFYLTLAKKNL